MPLYLYQGSDIGIFKDRKSESTALGRHELSALSLHLLLDPLCLSGWLAKAAEVKKNFCALSCGSECNEDLFLPREKQVGCEVGKERRTHESCLTEGKQRNGRI